MKYKILLILFSACVIISTLIATTPTSSLCGVGESGCSIVSNSKYSQTLGIDNSTWGMVLFSILLILTAVHMRRPTKESNIAIKILTTFVAIFGFYFLFVMAFIIKAWCKYCLVVDILAIVSMVFAFFYAEQD